MKRKNMISMVTSLALVGVVAVGGTLALLTEKSNDVTNTFSVGSAYQTDALTLDEVAVKRDTNLNNYGGYVANPAADPTRVQDGNKYEDLVAKTTLEKDPTFHLVANSPDSWIVAKVTGIEALKRQGVVIMGTTPAEEGVASVSLAEGYAWVKLNPDDGTTTPVADYANLTDGYYVFNEKVVGGASTDALFTNMYVKSTVNRPAGAEPMELTSIEVTGVAVEALNDTWAEDSAAVIAQIKADKDLGDFFPAQG